MVLAPERREVDLEHAFLELARDACVGSCRRDDAIPASMAYEGPRADTMDSHCLARSRGTAQQHDEAVSIRYCSIKEPCSLGMVGQIEERGAQLY